MVRSSASPKAHNNKPPVRKSAFVRLEYPMDYHLNYLSSSSPAHSHASNRTRPNPNRSVFSAEHRQKRVLLWVPRIQNSNAWAQTTTVPLQLCPKCLGPGHLRKACTNKVRYRQCFNYGHKSSACLSKARSQRRFQPVIRLEGEAARNTDIYHESTVSLDVSASAFPTVHQAQTVENPSSSIAMVN